MDNRSLALIAVLLVCFPGFGRQPADSGAQVGAGEQKQIERLIASLPTGSTLRRRLECGVHGDGLHRPYMDKMRREGVKRALVVTSFLWRGRPVRIQVADVLYFSKYGHRDCAQIRDPVRLRAIRESGLEQVLERVAIERTEKARWYFSVDRPIHRTKRGRCGVELVDNGWVPTPPAMLASVPGRPPDPLVGAVVRGDEIGVQRLLAAGVPKKELSAALRSAVVSGPSCMTSLLLQAGADPNAPAPDGFTPLMEAAHAGRPAIVTALLGAHADVTARDRWGDTALLIAEGNHSGEIVQLLKRAGARH